MQVKIGCFTGITLKESIQKVMNICALLHDWRNQLGLPLYRSKKELMVPMHFIKKWGKKAVESTLGVDAFSFWSETEKKWTIEPGEFQI